MESILYTFEVVDGEFQIAMPQDAQIVDGQMLRSALPVGAGQS